MTGDVRDQNASARRAKLDDVVQVARNRSHRHVAGGDVQAGQPR